MSDRVRLQALITPWQFLAAAAGTTVVLLGVFGNGDTGAMTWRLRLAGVAVAATAAFFFDDPAEATLAPAPTSLLVRRRDRWLAFAAFSAVWWSGAALLLEARFDVLVSRSLALEFAALALVTTSAALALARRSGTGSPGAIGAVFAPSWFGLGHLPRPDWVVIPPEPGGSETQVLVALMLAAVVVTISASRDPNSRLRRAETRNV